MRGAHHVLRIASGGFSGFSSGLRRGPHAAKLHRVALLQLLQRGPRLRVVGLEPPEMSLQLAIPEGPRGSSVYGFMFYESWVGGLGILGLGFMVFVRSWFLCAR